MKPSASEMGLSTLFRDMFAEESTDCCHQAAAPRHGAHSGSFHLFALSPQGELFELPLRRLQTRPSSGLAWRRLRGPANDFRLRIDRKPAPLSQKPGLWPWR